jgi:predicted transcriptional regulator
MPGDASLDTMHSGISSLVASHIKLLSLVQLVSGPLTLPALSRDADIRPSSLYPRLRELADDHILFHDNGNIHLTPIGRILARNIENMVVSFNGSEDGASLSSTGPRSVEGGAFRYPVRAAQRVIRSKSAVRMLVCLQNSDHTRKILQQVAGSAALFRSGLHTLWEAGLVANENGVYSLTRAGDAAVVQIRSVLETYSLLSRHREFWMVHSMGKIPVYFRNTLGCLHDAELIANTSTNTFRNFEHMIKVIRTAEKIRGISAWTSPGVAGAITERVREGASVELVVTPALYRELSRLPYSNQLGSLSGCERFRMYVTDYPIGVGMLVTDSCISCGFFQNDDVTYDCMHTLTSMSDRAVEWGRQLYRYYRDHALPVDPWALSASPTDI